MVYRIVVMPSAERDISEYTNWIASDSPRNARRWLSEVWEKIFSLTTMPYRFAVVVEAEELGVEVRDMLHYSHRIAYRIRETEATVEILRVWRSARAAIDLNSLFET